MYLCLCTKQGGPCNQWSFQTHFVRLAMLTLHNFILVSKLIESSEIGCIEGITFTLIDHTRHRTTDLSL